MNPSTKLWTIVLKESEEYDKTVAESWKGDMEGILFFVRPPYLLSPS